MFAMVPSCRLLSELEAFPTCAHAQFSPEVLTKQHGLEQLIPCTLELLDAPALDSMWEVEMWQSYCLSICKLTKH